MIPLLIRWTLACNYPGLVGREQAWTRERNTRQDIISVPLPFSPSVPRQRGIDSY